MDFEQQCNRRGEYRQREQQNGNAKLLQDLDKQTDYQTVCLYQRINLSTIPDLPSHLHLEFEHDI